jgi:hypothetical protein
VTPARAEPSQRDVDLAWALFVEGLREGVCGGLRGARRSGCEETLRHEIAGYGFRERFDRCVRSAQAVPTYLQADAGAVPYPAVRLFAGRRAELDRRVDTALFCDSSLPESEDPPL